MGEAEFDAELKTAPLESEDDLVRFKEAYANLAREMDKLKLEHASTAEAAERAADLNRRHKLMCDAQINNMREESENIRKALRESRERVIEADGDNHRMQAQVERFENVIENMKLSQGAEPTAEMKTAPLDSEINALRIRYTDVWKEAQEHATQLSVEKNEVEELSKVVSSLKNQEVEAAHSATVRIAGLMTELETLNIKSDKEMMSTKKHAEEWELAAKTFEKRTEETEFAELKTASLESEINALKVKCADAWEEAQAQAKAQFDSVNSQEVAERQAMIKLISELAELERGADDLVRFKEAYSNLAREMNKLKLEHVSTAETLVRAADINQKLESVIANMRLKEIAFDNEINVLKVKCVDAWEEAQAQASQLSVEKNELEEWSKAAISLKNEEVDVAHNANVQIAGLISELGEWEAANNFQTRMGEAEFDAELKTAPLESEINALKVKCAGVWEEPQAQIAHLEGAIVRGR